MDKRRQFGNASEIKAALFLEAQGYKILAHQFRTKFGEIDLVALDGEELVFVEVKARKNLKFGYPEEAVRHNKKIKMLASANIYMEEKQLFDLPFRLDIIAMLLQKNGQFEIKHLKAIDINEIEC